VSLVSPGLISRYVRNAFEVWQGREPLLHPLLVTFEITYRCNLYCEYCSDGTGRKCPDVKCPELTTAQVLRLLEILRPCCDVINVTGGEPLVRRDLEEVLAAARRMGFRVGLNTNALTLDERTGVLDLVDEVTTSLETLDPVKCARLFGTTEASARRVIANIDRLCEESHRRRFSVNVQGVIRRETIQDIRDVMEFCRQRDVRFAPSPEIVGIWPSAELTGDPAYRELMDEIARRKRAGERILNSIGFLEGVRDFRKFRCHPGVAPRVRSNGDLFYPCFAIQKVAANLLEAGSYETAIERGQARHGPVPACGNHCHFSCTMDFSLAVRRPSLLLAEGYYGMKRAVARVTGGTAAGPR
jgi:MoaA/NifB/PqqE/SkfB family radical SAM enzyme